MTILRSILKLVIGVSALGTSALGIFIAAAYTFSSSWIAFIPFSAILTLTLGLAAGLSWAGVRYGGMSANVAAALPAIPFAIVVFLALPGLVLGSLAVLLWFIPLVLALVIGRRAARFAQANRKTRAAMRRDPWIVVKNKKAAQRFPAAPLGEPHAS